MKKMIKFIKRIKSKKNIACTYCNPNYGHPWAIPENVAALIFCEKHREKAIPICLHEEFETTYDCHLAYSYHPASGIWGSVINTCKRCGNKEEFKDYSLTAVNAICEAWRKQESDKKLSKLWNSL